MEKFSFNKRDVLDSLTDFILRNVKPFNIQVLSARAYNSKTGAPVYEFQLTDTLPELNFKGLRFNLRKLYNNPHANVRQYALENGFMPTNGQVDSYPLNENPTLIQIENL